MTYPSSSSRWSGVFVDYESGVKHYEWGIGSVAGHADIMPFVKVTSEEATTDPGQPLMLQEGHSYYITIKVWRMTRVMTCDAYVCILF